MNEIKLIVNGKEVQLTEEQIKAINFTLEGTHQNPFDRINGEYYFIDETGKIDSCGDDKDSFDDSLYAESNYFNDEQFAKQVALHQLLYRKLLKYAYGNEFEDEEWDGTKMHAYIIYNFTRKDYDIRWTRSEKEPGTVYFKTPTRATAALNEVVMPFVKEHPEFKW